MTLNSDKFALIIDEPGNMNGEDEGHSPIQVLLMSLAGCLNVTGHEIARQKGLKLNGMKVKIEGVMDPCTFIGSSLKKRAGFQNIVVTANADIPGASEEKKEAWLKETEIRCPVTDNIKADKTVTVINK